MPRSNETPIDRLKEAGKVSIYGKQTFSYAVGFSNDIGVVVWSGARASWRDQWVRGAQVGLSGRERGGQGRGRNHSGEVSGLRRGHRREEDGAGLSRGRD